MSILRSSTLVRSLRSKLMTGAFVGGTEVRKLTLAKSKPAKVSSTVRIFPIVREG